MTQQEREWLLRDKYNGIESSAYFQDLKRLEAGEHIAYVIGWVPFLGTRILLDSHPLIPRPETEWWTENVIDDMKSRRGESIACLDLFSGSGCIGIGLLAHEPRAHVTFGEIERAHLTAIQKNLKINHIDESRFACVETNVWSTIEDTFDIITANPPYIPVEKRASHNTDLGMEPDRALYAGDGGLKLIIEFLKEAKKHLKDGGKLYMEFDTDQEQAILSLCVEAGLQGASHKDQYGRARYLVAK